MKVVINVCYGGFSLSPRGIQRWAELKGRECYFFTRTGYTSADRYVMVPIENIDGLNWHAFDIPNPDEVLQIEQQHVEWHDGSKEQIREWNTKYEKHSLHHGGIARDDPDLVRVVEELGGEHDGAAGRYAKLKIVEIPDGIDYLIDEYDGMERIAEKHRTWA